MSPFLKRFFSGVAPGPRRFWLALVWLVLPVATAGAQEQPVTTLLAPVDVSKGWKMKAGDDPANAKPDLDTGNWTDADLSEIWQSSRTDGFTWFRKSFRLAPSELNQPVGFVFGQIEFAGIQVFANGRNIATIGAFPPDSPREMRLPPVLAIPPEAIGPEGKLQLSIRLWKPADRSLPNAFLVGRYPPFRKTFEIGNVELLRDRVQLGRQEKLREDLNRLVLACLFLLICGYHLFMFTARRDRVEYVWFGAGTLCAGVMTFCNCAWSLEILPAFPAYVIWMALRPVALFTLATFIRIFFQREEPRWLRATFLGLLAYDVALALFPWISLTKANTALLIGMTPALLYVGWVIFREIRRGNPEAKPYLISLLFFPITQTSTILRETGIYDMPFIAHWGLGVVILGMAVSISDRFNRAFTELDTLNRDLEHKVVERTEELAQANVELADTVVRLEEAQAETERKNLELDRKISELNVKNQELVKTHQQADRIFSALGLALPGTILDGKYRLDEKIGEGGFGIVFRSTHLALTRPIAVKVFKPRHGNDNAEAIERFKREGISISRLSHPNIIAVLDSGVSDQGIAYLVMELLSGKSLAEELRSGAATTLRECLGRIIPVCRALAEAHRLGVIHRDIKPDNIFINRSPEGETVKVVDFGIAKMTASDTGEDWSKLTATDSLIGTPAYMSPERLSGINYDGRADVYSVGIVLYEMLAGRPPFEKGTSGIVGMILAHIHKAPPPLRELNPNIPESVAALIHRTLEKVPSERPTAAQLADQLEELFTKIPEAVLDRRFIPNSSDEEAVTTI
jgi:hypothetical protein